MSQTETYYQSLGLTPEASPEDVREAYKVMVKVWHPDRFAHDPALQLQAQEKLKEINEAYERLQGLKPDTDATAVPVPAGTPSTPQAQTTAAPLAPRTPFGAARPLSFPLWGRILIGLLILGVLFGLNAWIENPNFDQYQEGIIIQCGIALILAVALNIVNGFTGQFSLGHIGFYAIGAYLAAALADYGHFSFLFRHFPPDGSPVGVAQGWPILILCLLSGLAAAVVGFLVGLPSLRLRGDYLAIITLGFAQIIQVVIRNTKAVNGFTAFNGVTLHGVDITTPHLTNFFWVGLMATLVLWVSYGLRFSAHGLAFLAVREDEIAAEAMGINTTKYKVTAFVISAFFTGVAGALFAMYQPSLSNGQFSFVRSIDTVVMVVLGGLGSTSGVSLAAILLTILPEALRPIEQYRLVLYPLLLIVLMLTRPQGIFGREELSRKWLAGQVAAVKGWFGRRPAAPALATGPNVMTTARDREETERKPQE